MSLSHRELVSPPNFLHVTLFQHVRAASIQIRQSSVGGRMFAIVRATSTNVPKGRARPQRMTRPARGRVALC